MDRALANAMDIQLHADGVEVGCLLTVDTHSPKFYARNTHCRNLSGNLSIPVTPGGENTKLHFFAKNINCLHKSVITYAENICLRSSTKRCKLRIFERQTIKIRSSKKKKSGHTPWKKSKSSRIEVGKKVLIFF